ncbi:MAG: aminopeptidase [Bacteroidota bacterium]|jgi:predicted aminopeptidase
MRPWLRKVFLVFALIIAVLSIWKFDLILYGFRQLNGQIGIINGSKPISELISSGSLDSATKAKLLYIEEVRKFAIDSLGLKDTENYTTYFDQQNKPIMWVVTGSLPYELKEKTWWFPVINTVSYKGFFLEELALEEAKQIESEGYESDIYNPSGWSTLGFFTDPVLSGMLARGPGKLAELIMHEMAHETVYLRSEVDLNENLATLVGEVGAMRFLDYKFGVQSVESIRYRERIMDDQIYYKHMLEGYKRLDSLYQTFKDGMKTKVKAQKKYELITDVLLGINQIGLKNKSIYLYDFSKGKLPGNPEFISYSRYRRDLDQLENTLKTRYDNHIGSMLEAVKKQGREALN